MSLNEKVSEFERPAMMFKALGHPTRLFIVDMLSKGEACVCDITAAVGLDISTVSKHLSVLKNAAIVVPDKISNKIMYRLNCKCIAEHTACMDKFWGRKKY